MTCWTQEGWTTHEVVFDLLAGGGEEVPDGRDEGWQVGGELLVVLLGVQADVVAHLRLHLLQQPRLLLVLQTWVQSGAIAQSTT